MAEYEHNGCIINRDPVPVAEGNTETTGWMFTVNQGGNPIPVIVVDKDRHLGLRETRRGINRFVREANDAARIGDLQPNHST